MARRCRRSGQPRSRRRARSSGLRFRAVVGGSRGWRTVCLRAGGGPPRESNASWHDWVSGNAEGSVPGGDRALATTSGRHHGQAIRIDSFEVDDCLILGRPPGSVKARRRILATPGRCTHKERCPRIERPGALSRTARRYNLSRPGAGGLVPRETPQTKLQKTRRAPWRGRRPSLPVAWYLAAVTSGID